MGKSTAPVNGRPAALIDELTAQNKLLSKAQARSAELMVEFADRRADGADPRYKAGEFAAVEIGMAVTTTKHAVHRTVAMTRRLQTECPDAWDAWRHGDINQDKAIRINRALRRLVHDKSKEFLNSTVVDVAVCKTPELLGRWLNGFVASTEPV